MILSSSSIPPLPNPLHNKALYQAHVSSLRLESELAPMKSILFKLMGHAQYNRRGIFNAPVDPVALNLADYNQIISTPMDLGTIKAKLHALAYSSREQVADDVRLVFRNAILYNPQEHFVHVAARNLLGIFEAGYLNACQRLGEEVDVYRMVLLVLRPNHLLPSPPVLLMQAFLLLLLLLLYQLKSLPTRIQLQLQPMAICQLVLLPLPALLLLHLPSRSDYFLRVRPSELVVNLKPPPNCLYILMGMARCLRGYVQIAKSLQSTLARRVLEEHVPCANKDA